ncbi:MAG: OsmC family protein [Cyclobacteriaceae bacterium]|nr:OsmC family protein [Cyclobacteriaceae bacterium]
MKAHNYALNLRWTGNTGNGTKNYTGYERSYQIDISGKPSLEGSSDPSFRGDRSKYNPEELFLMSIAACHMLWYLHLCADAGITVISYEDQASGTMMEAANGSGSFERVILKPSVAIVEKGKKEQATILHKKANAMCFIANSCNFPILHEPVIL